MHPRVAPHAAPHVAVTAGVAALTSAFPALYDDRLCLAVLVLITAVNLRRIVESAGPRSEALRAQHGPYGSRRPGVAPEPPAPAFVVPVDRHRYR
ncbi:hypothetical protein [Streptomyces sp. NPDC001222]|uniref:hypothetical protein n=1 Tax=Streptomyces sp. NPDC001222 TaxID=3364548 RepID=UPI0036D10052